MNILFIYSFNNIQSPIKPLQTPEQIHFGISYLSAFLKKHRHNTKLIILSRMSGKKNKQFIDKAIGEFAPKLVCFTTVATEYPFVADIAKYIKSQYKDIYLAIGGAHASLNPETVLLDDFDALCIGEGEYAMLELVSQLEKGELPSGIPNLWFKRCSHIEKNATRPFLQDVDSLPFLDREMWQEWIDAEPGARPSILLSRGCPFQCTYCCNHAFRKLAQGTYVRFRSPDNIIGEIKEIVARFPTTKAIALEAETVGINQEWAIELCAKLQDFNSSRKQPLSFEANLRITPNMKLERMFDAFKKSNIQSISIGLESGSERVRYKILKRNYLNKHIIDAVALAKKYGLGVNLFNLIGLPGETLDDFKETVRMNRICLPDQCYTSIFFPYPGTDLHFLCKEMGLLDNPLDVRLERTKAILDLPEFSRKQIQKSYVWFDYYVYKGHKPLYRLLAKVFSSRIKANYYLTYFYRMFTRLSFLKKIKNILIAKSILKKY
jgi:radical SAM superfamily enzyme YgiQ (UPF0313 family)